jgi:hypothetical protein
MSVRSHSTRLLTALIALCGSFLLQRAESCLPGDFARLRADRGADAFAVGTGADGLSLAAPAPEPSDALEASGPAGFDPDSGDDCAPARAWMSRLIASSGLPVTEGRGAILEPARRSSRSARGPPATA